MKAVILCGGKGTRMHDPVSENGRPAAPVSHEDVPKALFPIGGKPIVWHIMKGLRTAGLKEFVLCLGHRGDAIRRYFAPESKDLPPTEALTVRDRAEDWTVTMVDTGEATNTGGRVFRAAPYLDGEQSFLATYGDGLASIDAAELLRFHREHGRLATVTAVRARCQFGVVSLSSGGEVRRFLEKPPLRSWINGGFFVFDRRVLPYLASDPVLEDGPINRLAGAGQMMAYRHRGFWACMDTYKDFQFLNELWNQGRAGWKTWS